MFASVSRTLSVTQRVLGQLRHDRRFIAFTLGVPLAVVYVLFIFFDALKNPQFNATQFVIPFGAFVIHFLTFVLTAIVLVRERVTGTLTRSLVNSYGQAELILGYLLAYSTLATLQSLLVLSELTYLFKFDYSLETLASIYLVMWLLAVISMALGIFMSNFALNEGQVLPFVPLVLLPSIFLSGMILPVDQLPEWAQTISRFTPLFYATEILHNLVNQGTLADEARALLSLPLYGLVILLLARFTLRESS